MENHWRLTNQMDYLFQARLIKKHYSPINQKWDHDHCSFCTEKFYNIDQVGYCTEDEYYWICDGCFHGFKDMFKWTVVNEEG
ncbi:hypothetical protein GCM10010885_19570 [Alicyclobacillus cellulosilyticus]|uniref:Uncharacterized protein n=1 Tax=Alicyclobacillus cellulosilyticus TaxID=1003997 RepID=A0A917KFU0_9BACL|nr:hypothetical protein GCM10010885_19570 [Alicyclobacillus cellulosilyticus]